MARKPRSYRVWLSEIMLQQTRVNAVVERYRRFLKLFPTVETLAASSLDSVLAAWSGLGYYRRARMLHLAAQEVAEERGGQFPSASELRNCRGSDAIPPPRSRASLSTSQSRWSMEMSNACSTGSWKNADGK